MTIEIHLQGQLAEKYGPTMILNLKGPISVGELISKTGLASEELGIVAVDGRQIRMSDLVPEHGRVSIFPWMSGG